MNDSRKSIFPKKFIIFFISASLLFSIFIPAIKSSNKNLKKLFETAESEYKQFIEKTGKHIYPEEWEKCVNRYREIVILNEKSIYADDAAYMVAYIYFRMYERFSNMSYLNSSISSFSFLLSHYPDSLYIKKVLYYSGLINYKYLNNYEKSRQFFNALINKYGDSSYAEKAKELLDSMARASVPASPAERSEFAKLIDLRYWSSPDYTRVVAYFDSPVSFKNKRLYKPDRIYFDIERTRISKRIAEWMMVMEDNFLRRVRIAHFNPKTTRIVLDFEKVGKYSVFALNDPYRIVVDITSSDYGESTTLPELAHLKNDKDETPSKKGERPKTGDDRTGSDVTRTPKGDADQNGSDSRSAEVKAADKGKTMKVVPLRNSDGNYSIVRQLGLGVTTIVIDPGHGGKDPGMVIKKGVYEKDLVLDFAFRLKSTLEKDKKYQVYLTRTSDKYLSLEERTAKAMQYKADLFISLHMNSYKSSKLRGMETYYLGFATDRQTEALAAQENAINQKSIGELQDILRLLVDAKVDESKDAARIISSTLSRRMKKRYSNFRSRGVKQAPFIVLIGANMPSLLLELGYLSNSLERRWLLSKSYRQTLAESVARGIVEYIENLSGKLVES